MRLHLHKWLALAFVALVCHLAFRHFRSASDDQIVDSRTDEVAAPRASLMHPDRVALIKKIESSPDVLWKAAASTRFVSSAPGASRDMLGVKDDTDALRAMALDSSPVVSSDSDDLHEIPDSFDSATHWPQCRKSITHIRDQSNCGCCWAFAAAGAASDRLCIETGGKQQLPLSAEDVCFNGGEGLSDGCNGGTLLEPWLYMREMLLPHRHGRGVVTGGEYDNTGPYGGGWCSKFSKPHCHHHGPSGDDPYPEEGSEGCPSQESSPGPSRCDSDSQVPHSNYAQDKITFKGHVVQVDGEEAMQREIMRGGPMEVSYTVYEDFENYVSGIYHHVEGEKLGGHAVKVVGWGVEDGVKYWKMANSWNPYWGEGGYFRILRGTNECGIEEGATASSAGATWMRRGGWPTSPGTAEATAFV